MRFGRAMKPLLLASICFSIVSYRLLPRFFRSLARQSQLSEMSSNLTAIHYTDTVAAASSSLIFLISLRRNVQYWLFYVILRNGHEWMAGELIRGLGHRFLSLWRKHRQGKSMRASRFALIASMYGSSSFINNQLSKSVLFDHFYQANLHPHYSISP